MDTATEVDKGSTLNRDDELWKDCEDLSTTLIEELLTS